MRWKDEAGRRPRHVTCVNENPVHKEEDTSVLLHSVPKVFCFCEIN